MLTPFGVFVHALTVILPCRAVAESQLWVLTVTNGDFELGVGNTKNPNEHVSYLKSAPIFFTYEGQRYSTDNGRLKSNGSYGTSGRDWLGPWQSLSNYYQIAGHTLEISLKTYQTDALPLVIWTQKFISGLNKTKATSVDHTISGYPAINIAKQANLSLGYLSLSGNMFGYSDQTFGLWEPSKIKLKGGIKDSGPVAIFDKSGNTFLFAPFNEFMASSVYVNKGVVNWGVMGGVDSVPAGFELSTVMYYSNKGINKAFEEWGNVMRYYYNKTDELRKHDEAINYLGYWTDNGAYYYYNTEPKKNYAETLMDVQNYLHSINFRARYLELDSWWYPKDANNAVVTWNAMASVFPKGLVNLRKSLNTSFVAHNKYWSPNTTYAKQNGGKFHFIKEKNIALPDDPTFWEYLFAFGNSWGLKVYEQDWLHYQTEKMVALQSDVTLGRRWLQQMARAAADHGITIQYCTALPRHALQTLEFPSVTQARVSNDYLSDPDQWKIGVTSLLAAAVGVAPFKDNFWTVSVQEGNTYNKTEPYPELQAVVAALSTGPVGPSDRIGHINKTLVSMIAAEDGLILKPSKPATAVDDQLLELAFQDGSGGVHGEVWSTYSDIGNFRFGYVLTAFLAAPYTVTPEKLGLHRQHDKFQNRMVIAHTLKETVVTDFNSTHGFPLPANNKADPGSYYTLYVTSPVVYYGTSEYILLGEDKKFIRFSPQRIFKIWETNDFLAVTYTGTPGEQAIFEYLLNRRLTAIYTSFDLNYCASFVVYNASKTNVIPHNLNCRKSPPTTTTHKPTSQQPTRHQPTTRRHDVTWHESTTFSHPTTEPVPEIDPLVPETSSPSVSFFTSKATFTILLAVICVGVFLLVVMVIFGLIFLGQFHLRLAPKPFSSKSPSWAYEKQVNEPWDENKQFKF